MAPLIGRRSYWWQKAFIKYRGMISMKLFLQWSNLPLLDSFLHWHSIITGAYINWMSTMPSSMVFFMKPYTCNSLLGSLHKINHLSADWTRLSMGSNNPLDSGLKDSKVPYCSLGFTPANVTLLSSSTKRTKMLFTFWSMLMISSLLEAPILLYRLWLVI